MYNRFYARVLKKTLSRSRNPCHWQGPVRAVSLFQDSHLTFSTRPLPWSLEAYLSRLVVRLLQFNITLSLLAPRRNTALLQSQTHSAVTLVFRSFVSPLDPPKGLLCLPLQNYTCAPTHHIACIDTSPSSPNPLPILPRILRPSSILLRSAVRPCTVSCHPPRKTCGNHRKSGQQSRSLRVHPDLLACIM